MKKVFSCCIIAIFFSAQLVAEVSVSGEAAATISKNNLFETFKSGGWVMWPILLCSLISLAFALERFLNLRFEVIVPKKFSEEYQKVLNSLKGKDQKQQDELVKSLMTEGASEGEILFSKFLKRNYNNVRDLEQVLQEYVELTQYRLQKNIKPVGLISQVSPLLGLFGTVLGMIKAFDVVATQGLGKPEVLANGMAVALLTTGFGLGVAIPSSLIYHHLSEKASKASIRLYTMLHELVLARGNN